MVMAEVRIIDNATRCAGDELIASLQWATDVRIASAFATRGALTKMLSPLEHMLSRGGSVTLLYGLDCHITDPEFMEQVRQLSHAYPLATQYVHLSWADAVHQTFHTKLYIAAEGGSTAQVLIGSSNLTLGGLWKNTEANALLRGPLNDEAIQDACAVYNRIRGDTAFAVPDEQVVADYRELRKRAVALPAGPKPPVELADAYRHIKAHLATLPSVWADDVLSRICALTEASGADVFTLKDFNSRFEDELAALHPNNKHVRAKIRQQMQVLRDRSALEFLGRGRYRIRR